MYMEGHSCLIPFPNDKFQTLPNLKEFTDNNFEFDDNGEKLSKRIENTVEKGEIARYEQFLFFPQCFKRLVLQIRKNKGLSGKGLRNKSQFLSHMYAFKFG